MRRVCVKVPTEIKRRVETPVGASELCKVVKRLKYVELGVVRTDISG